MSSYRLWIYTSDKDQGDIRDKGELTLLLAGTLREATFASLEKVVARQGQLYAKGHCCEISLEAEDVGDMLELTVIYTVPGVEAPWYLTQIIVREGTTGTVRVFPVVPAGQPLEGNKILKYQPSLTWFEDRYGNCYEDKPEVQPLGGQWQWPLMPLISEGAGGADAALLSENAQLQHRLWEAACKEEITPLVDAALNDLAQQRTPGTLLHECMQAAAGKASAGSGGSWSRSNADELKRRNMELSSRVRALEVGASEIERVRLKNRQLETEKREMQAEMSRQVNALKTASARSDKSAACVIA